MLWRRIPKIRAFSNTCFSTSKTTTRKPEFYGELSPYRRVLRDDDFSPGLKLETRLRNIRTCRWLVPVLSQSFVDDGECCDFIARAQYARPHAIVPVVWTEFHTDDLTINSLLDTAEPSHVAWRPCLTG